ncbi:ammonium transporter [Mycobacterium leprae]|uniref:ammonium transporter n=1 Tax=Mycobacterium leprae TaxID=1769 RepID=UPI000674471A
MFARAYPRRQGNNAGLGLENCRRTGRHHACLCSSVNVLGALVAGVVCALACGLKFRLGFDDSLDMVGVHMVGGLAGTLLADLLAAPEPPST